MRTRTFFASVIAVTALSAAPGRAAVHDFVVYLPGMGGSAETAQGAIATFCRYLEGELKWPANACTGQYLDDAPATRAAIEGKKPGFGMIDAGTYLDLACGKGTAVEPIAAVGLAGMSRSVKYHVVAKAGVKSLDELRGKKLVSNHLANPKLVSRVLLAGKVDVEKHFQLSSTKSPKKPLKALADGSADAALLSDAQLAELQKQEFGKGFAAVFSSEPLPPYPVVAFPSVAKPADRDAVKQALLGMCASKSGAPVCQSLQIERFEALDAAALKPAVQQYCK
jgi:hypothetical protein